MKGQIINFHGDPHRDVLTLLPWYVTGQLDAADIARVEGHLGSCVPCQAALAVERQLDLAIGREPASVDQGWAVLRRRLELDRPVAAARSATADAGGRPAAKWWERFFGWQLPAPFALASLVGVMLVSVLAPARFTALGSAPQPVAGNMVVIFQPDTSETMFRQILRASNARLVDGPTAANAYVIQVPTASRIAVLDRLRRQPQIVLAEPVDPAAKP